jgi:hypothetical protein
VSFKDKSWNARFAAMGDEAEQKFEAVMHARKRGFVRTGLNRPPLRMSMLPPFVRYTPDYLTSKCYVEVQGLGEDQLFKMKVDKWDALESWHTEFPVELFVWDSYHERHTQLTLPRLRRMLSTAEVGMFHEGKKYYALEADKIFNASKA